MALHAEQGWSSCRVQSLLIIVVYGMNGRVFLSQGTETVATWQVAFRKGWGKRNVNEGDEKGKSREEEEGLMCRRGGKVRKKNVPGKSS
jgi:hypothetical protein